MTQGAEVSEKSQPMLARGKPLGEGPSPQLHIVLFTPEIPQNTGNIGRTCAYLGARLHLVHPLGFVISDRHLRRAGMDYWRALDVVEHADWTAFRQSPLAPRRLFLFTTKSHTSFWQASFQAGDGLVFGCESKGCPPWLHAEVGASQSLFIDGNQGGLRSLNLASSVAIAAYEAERQLSQVRPSVGK